MKFHTWAEMKIILEDFFQASIVINPFLDDEALIKCNKKINFDFANHWYEFGQFHLKLEAGSKA